MSDFIHDSEKRRKTVIPDLGEFVTLVSLDIEFTFADLKEAYLAECYARNALWTVRQFPHLRKTEFSPAIDKSRPEESFASNSVSLRLCLFHVYFNKKVGRPLGMTGKEIAARYDSRLGRPSRAMREEWQTACKEILAVSSWNEYFAHLGDPAMSRDNLNQFLRETMAISPYVGRKPQMQRSWRPPSANKSRK